MKPKPVFTQYQEDFIRDNYKTMRNIDIAKELGLKEPLLWKYKREHGFTKYKKAKVVKMAKRSRFFNVNEKENWAIG